MEDYTRIKQVGKAVGYILQKLKEETKVGMTGRKLEKLALELMKERKEKERVRSSIKGYAGFPGAICVSVNANLTHGIPNEYPFQEGDLVSIDVACNRYGIHADAALTTIVGKGTKEQKELLEVTEGALQEAINSIKPGITTNQDIGHTIEQYIAEKNKNREKDKKYYVIRRYGGHGIGREMHQEPFIPNFRDITLPGITIQKNAAICIEPLVQMGDEAIELAADKWTVLSKNGNLNAHFEHTIWIGDKEVEIMTKYEQRLSN